MGSPSTDFMPIGLLVIIIGVALALEDFVLFKTFPTDLLRRLAIALGLSATTWLLLAFILQVFLGYGLWPLPPLPHA